MRFIDAFLLLVMLESGRIILRPVHALLALSSRYRYRARVAYDGTNFQGFQIQQGSKRRTVQGEVEQVLSQRLNEAVRVVAAGRTGRFCFCERCVCVCADMMLLLCVEKLMHCI